jgi:hypothetical protein
MHVCRYLGPDFDPRRLVNFDESPLKCRCGWGGTHVKVVGAAGGGGARFACPSYDNTFSVVPFVNAAGELLSVFIIGRGTGKLRTVTHMMDRLDDRARVPWFKVSDPHYVGDVNVGAVFM